MRSEEDQLISCNPNDQANWAQMEGHKKIERNANIFAASFLIPRKLLLPLCEEHAASLECISKLAETFHTSLTATAIRYVECSEDPIFLFGIEDGLIRWFCESSSGNDIRTERKYSFSLRTQLSSDSVAWRLLHSESRAEKSRFVPLSAWFFNGKEQDPFLYEDSIYFASSRTGLTLLHLEEEGGGDEDQVEDDEDEGEHIPSWRRSREC